MASEITRLTEPLTDDALVDFIRGQGAVTTSEVAWRYSWWVDDARRRLKRLERQGRLTSRMEPYSHEGGGGKQLIWSPR